MRIRWLSYGLLVVLGHLTAGAAPGQDAGKDPRLVKVLADWKHRQTQLKTARYTITGTVEFKDTPLLPDDPPLPAGNPVRPKRVVMLLDLERRRYRLESTEDVLDYSRGGYVRRISTSAFDGQILHQFTHREANGFADGPDLAIAKGDLYQQQLETSLLPVFFAHGIIPTSHAPLSPKTYAMAPVPEGLELLGVQTLNNRSCLVARTDILAGNPPIVDEFWIDPTRDGAIPRYVIFSGNRPWERTDIEWKKYEDGWKPDQWTLTWSVAEKVKRLQKLRIDKFEANPMISDDDFTLRAKPGMQVLVHDYPELGTDLDPRYPANRTYRVSPSGSWEELTAQGFTTLDGQRLPPTGRSWLWWAIGMLAGAALAALFWVWRRRHRSATLFQ